MSRYFWIALAAVASVLILSVSLKGCTFTTPTPVAQTASQQCHAFGFIVSNACNQTINKGVDRNPNGGSDPIMTIVVILLGMALLLVIGAYVWRMLFSGGG